MMKIREGPKEKYVAYVKNQIKDLIDKYDTNILWFNDDLFRVVDSGR